MEPNLTSDENLRKTLLAFLASDSLTASEDLHVGVLNGIVHLAGIVTSIEVRVAAAEHAARVHNVRGVVNRIEAPGAPSPSRTINIETQINENK